MNLVVDDFEYVILELNMNYFVNLILLIILILKQKCVCRMVNKYHKTYLSTHATIEYLAVVSPASSFKVLLRYKELEKGTKPFSFHVVQSFQPS